jgi:glycosyltransferase involved in cell wall biosynthesis
MSERTPRVSIGLPVYNGEDYLVETLDSLLAQTFTDFELIICDNASSDATQEICEGYAAKDRRIRYVRNAQNLGAAKNYNKTFELAAGEYFRWNSYDDTCAPQYLEQCVQKLDREPGVILCYSKTILIDGRGEVLEYYSDDLDLRSPVPHERFRKLLHTPGWCNPIFGLIRSRVLAKTPLIGAYPRSDRTLLGQLALMGEFCELPDFLFSRRVHDKISTEVNVSERDLAAWFDTSTRGKLIFPRWRRYFEYLKAIMNAPISLADRMHSLSYIAGFALSNRKWQGLAGDVSSMLRPGATRQK